MIGGCLALYVSSASAQWLSWPPAESARTPAATPNAAVRLRIERLGGQREVWIDNDVVGPVELRIDSSDPLPGFPLQRDLSGPGPHLIAMLPGSQTLRLKLHAVPGPRNPRVDDVAYAFPLRWPRLQIAQSPHGDYSHADAENREAIDFAAPIGTPVIAARAGRVMQAEGRFSDTPGKVEEANFIRILHADGSMAVYAHLQQGSLRVAAGHDVRMGDHIANSGNSGYSTGPHLHFVVQVNAGLRLWSVPVRIATDAGELRLPRRAQP